MAQDPSEYPLPTQAQGSLHPVSWLQVAQTEPPLGPPRHEAPRHGRGELRPRPHGRQPENRTEPRPPPEAGTNAARSVHSGFKASLELLRILGCRVAPRGGSGNERGRVRADPWVEPVCGVTGGGADIWTAPGPSGSGAPWDCRPAGRWAGHLGEAVVPAAGTARISSTRRVRQVERQATHMVTPRPCLSLIESRQLPVAKATGLHNGHHWR
jgi:hypothetical protein